MNRGDEMAANIETGERQSASGPAGSDEKSDQQLHTILENIGRAAHQDELHSGFTPRLDLETLERKPNDRLGAIENQAKKRSSRGFTRYLLAICIGVAATLAWQSYGVEHLGWTKPPATPAVRSSATEMQQVPLAQFPVSPSVPVAPSIDPAEVHQIAMDLAALRQTVAQITASQDQLARKVDTIQAANQQILAKMPEPPPPLLVAAAPAVSSGVTPPSENTQNTAPTSASLALRASCGPDVQRLCRGISMENGGVIKCLASHRMEELSPTCVAYFREMPGHRAAQTNPKPTPPSSRAPMPPYIPPHP